MNAFPCVCVYVALGQVATRIRRSFFFFLLHIVRRITYIKFTLNAILTTTNSENHTLALSETWLQIQYVQPPPPPPPPPPLLHSHAIRSSNLAAAWKFVSNHRMSSVFSTKRISSVIFFVTNEMRRVSNMKCRVHC